MPQKRRASNGHNESEDRFQIRSLALNLPTGYTIHSHAHDWHQLIYASRGVMTVNTTKGTWVVPSKRAVWVPGGITHEIEMTGAVWMRTLYLSPKLKTSLTRHCHVIDVSPLLRELILHTIDLGMLDREVSFQRRLIEVIVDQLNSVAAVPLKLPMPNDARALRIAEALRESPGDTTSLAYLSRESGASKRTIERLFQSETEMSFGKWRQQLRLLHALRLLALGESVTAAALEVGYDSTSAFISAFKTVLGTTPGRYYADSQIKDRIEQRTTKAKAS
jgi:AraC-like DNA-binding protein/quercetin dioxygenase-like cupin family protein